MFGRRTATMTTKAIRRPQLNSVVWTEAHRRDDVVGTLGQLCTHDHLSGWALPRDGTQQRS